VVTVADRLDRAGHLDEIGGRAVLVDWAAGVPAVGNAGRYAWIVIEHWRRWQLVVAGADLAAAGHAGTDPTVIVERLTQLQSSAGLARFRSTRLADVEPERVRWLWPGHLPLGKLVVLDGDPDVGKSTLALDFVARTTTGRPFPGEDQAAAPASDVVLLAAEDGLADTIRPRLDAAGADVTRIHHLDRVRHVDTDGHEHWALPSIPEDVDALDQLVTTTSARLIVVDVLMAYLSGRADSFKDADVRRCLEPLSDLADRHSCCVLLLRHLRKSRSSALAEVAAAPSASSASPEPP
jgi:hypothetical protein